LTGEKERTTDLRGEDLRGEPLVKVREEAARE